MGNENLKQIKNNLMMLPVLLDKAEKISQMIKEAKDNVKSLLQKYEKEALDVKKLESDSLSATLLKLFGRYEGKMDKEAKEMIHAKIEYDKATDGVKNLQFELEELRKRIATLEEEKQTYEEEIRNREQLILNTMNNELSNQYKKLVEKEKKLNQQLIEMEEALSAANIVKTTAQSTMEHLVSAENWATYDVWLKGGILSHMAKYEHVDEAEANFNRLSSQLKNLKKELSDIDILDIPELSGIDSTTRAIDFWFDNIFTDLSVREKIKDDAQEIRRLSDKIDNIITNIDKNKIEIIKNLEDIESMKNEMIISL